MKANRIGEINILKCGEKGIIQEYNNAKDIFVKIESTGEIIHTTYSNFKKGKVGSNFTPSVYNVGIVGLINTVDDNGKRIKSYEHWKGMLRRCYSKKSEIKYPTYKDCSVCDEWLYFPNFKKWFDENYYEIDNETMCLDKDILHKGNKIYSPENCVFAPNRINVLFVKNNSKRGSLPIGVCYRKDNNKYSASLRMFDIKNKKLGCYNTPEEVFNAYKIAKENYIKEVADEYKDKIPNNLYMAMYDYKVEITD